MFITNSYYNLMRKKNTDNLTVSEMSVVQWNSNYNTSLAIFYKFLPKTTKTISIYLCEPIGFRMLRYAVAVFKH